MGTCFLGGVCFSHSDQPTNRCSSRNIVLYGGGFIDCASNVHLIPNPNPSESSTSCLTTSMRIHGVHALFPCYADDFEPSFDDILPGCFSLPDSEPLGGDSLLLLFGSTVSSGYFVP